MNTEKIEKLKKSLSNPKIPADLKPKIEAEIKRLEDLDAKKSEPKEEEKPVAEKTTTRKPRATKSTAKKTSTRKPSQTSKPKRTAMSVAKEIRKDGESWKDAMARASKMMKEKTHTATKDVESELQKLTKLVRGKKELKGQVYKTDLLRDAKRKAKPMGRRISKDGNVYYENRPEHSDRGSFGKYHLAEGGYLTDPTFGNFQNTMFADGGGIPNNYAGKTPEQVWNMWTEKQKQHFLVDHFNHFIVEEFKGKNLIDISRLEYKKLPLRVRLELDFHVNKGQYAKGGGVRKVGNREYSLGRNWTNDHEHTNKGEEHEVKYTRKKRFELGGTVVTDLAGHTGGALGGDPTMLDGISGTSYTGLVGETGAMSSGEMFEYGGGLPAGVNQSYMVTEAFGNPAQHYGNGGGLPAGAEQSYINYYLGEGSAQGIYAKGGGVRKVGNREYSYGRNWTNDHEHTNKGEEHEVKYTRKKSFAGGGGVGETPKIYVADLEAYNNGKLSGVWLDLADYNDADELMEAIQDFLNTTGGEEYAIHDAEYIPSSMYSEYMGQRDFEELYEMIDLAKDNDLPLSVVQEVVSQYDASAVEEFQGKYDDAEDFAQQLVDDIGIESFTDFQYYLEVSDTDRRLLAQEMADSYVDDIRDEDGGNRLIEEAGMDVSEYEDADSDRQEEMLDEAREIVYDEYYDNWYEGLSDPYYFLVEEQGLYDTESFANANFVRVDYEKLGRDLEQDYTFIYDDGELYVFNIR